MFVAFVYSTSTIVADRGIRIYILCETAGVVRKLTFASDGEKSGVKLKLFFAFVGERAEQSARAGCGDRSDASAYVCVYIINEEQARGRIGGDDKWL